MLQDVARLRRRVCWQRAALTALRAAPGLGLAPTLVWALALPVGHPLLSAVLAALLLPASVVAAIAGDYPWNQSGVGGR